MNENTFMGRAEVLAELERLHEAGRLGQPLLLNGPAGSGRENTALEFARRLNCAAPATCTAAAPCESCTKARGFQHPDIRWLGPAPAATGEAEVRELFEAKLADPFHENPWAASGQILIGDPENPGPLTVRSLIRFLRLRAFQGRTKVAVVADAQRLNTAAANAFLKTLEEPPPDTVIMLLTSGVEGLLPTIVSRCRQVAFAPWPEEQLTSMIGALAGVDEPTARDAARRAQGDARRALGLLRPEARILTDWALALFGWIDAGRRGQTAIAADELHRGAVSHACLPPDATPKSFEAKEPALRRGRAIRLCEMLNLLYSDAVACREIGPDWKPRLSTARDQVAGVAARRSTEGLLRGMKLIETAKQDVDRNINIGLAMAVLFEGLIAHAEDDRTGHRAAAS